jgi:hypothetical protein
MYRALSWFIDYPRDSSIDWNIDNVWAEYNVGFTLTTARSPLRLKKRDATLKPRAVINMIMPAGIIMLMTGGFL